MMIRLEPSLIELKSRRAQLEIQLLGLRRRQADLTRERARQAHAIRSDQPVALADSDVEARLRDVSSQIDKVGATVRELDQRISDFEGGGENGGSHHFEGASREASGALEQVRTHVLETLRSLAEPLREHERLAERQRVLRRRLREVTGQDNRYATYLDTALLRASDQDEDLCFVLDFLRRVRVVA